MWCGDGSAMADGLGGVIVCHSRSVVGAVDLQMLERVYDGRVDISTFKKASLTRWSVMSLFRHRFSMSSVLEVPEQRQAMVRFLLVSRARMVVEKKRILCDFEAVGRIFMGLA